MRSSHSLLLTAVVLGACALDSGEHVGTDPLAISLDAEVIQFLNDSTTTVELLDGPVELDRRAADNLVARRDEAPFVTIDEVDAVAWVGPVALRRLRHFVRHRPLIAFLNAPSTTLSVLDEEVPLHRLAAQNLIAHRDGPDGEFDTDDDDLFDNLREADEVRWVGPAALAALVDFVELRGPAGDNVRLGVVEGVSFTHYEGRRVIEFVNSSDEITLLRAGVLRSGRESILTARPIEGEGLEAVEALAALSGIGQATLENLLEYTIPFRFDPPCSGATACETGVCTGVGPGDIGVCRDLSALPSEGDACCSETECDARTFCSGLTLGETGVCRPEWTRGRFESGGISSIPAIVMPRPSGVLVPVRGRAEIPMDVVVDIALEHEAPSSLRFTLTSPDGSEVELWNGPEETGAFPGRFVASAGFTSDARANGYWSLGFQNLEGEGRGTLQGYVLHLSTRGRGSCEPESRLPERTDYADRCAEEMHQVVTAPLEGRDLMRNFALDDRCELTPLLQRALHYYLEYFAQDVFEGESELDFLYENPYRIETLKTSLGTVVRIELEDSDELLLTLVFDRDDELIMFSHEEQGSRQRWFCGGDEPASSAPEVECIVSYLRTVPGVPSPSETTELSGSVAELEASELVTLPRVVRHYANTLGLADDAPLALGFRSWWADAFDQGTRVQLTDADGRDAVYFASSDEWTYTVQDAARLEFICER